MVSIIWIGVAIIIPLALYIRFFRGSKSHCKVTLFEKNGDLLVKHDKEYKAILREVRNVSDTKKIRWLHIQGIKKDWIIPKSDKFIPSTKGVKNLCLVWLGGNNFQVMKPKFRKYEYVLKGKTKTGEVVYNRKKTDDLEMYIMPEDLKYAVAELEDAIETIYQKKAGLLDKIKPYLMIGVIAVVAIAAMKITADENRDTSSIISGAVDKLVDFSDSQTERQVDDQTTTTRTTGGGS